ncbi:hypothetical protein AHAS_Ahas20G0206300 [Arachis hypogaea]
MEQQLLGYEGSLYRLDQAEHIAGRLDRVAPRILPTRWNLMTRPPEAFRPYLRRAGFEYVAYMVEFEYDWPLASALLERWRPESHTIHLACGEMTITLKDVAYQLRLRIDGDSVSGCIGSWEQHHQGRTIEDFCQEVLGVVLGANDRQSQTKWTVKLTWFLNTICGELEQDATEERLLRYTRGYIMQLIGVFYSQMHLTLGCTSGGSPCWKTSMHVVGCRRDRLYWLGCTARCAAPRSMVEWTPYADPQLEGLVPHEIAEVDHTAAVVCPLLYFSIIEWHQVDRVVREFGGLQHIPTRPLDIDSMHGMDGRFGRELFGQGDQHLIPARVVPEDLPLYHPPAPKLHQPEDGHHLPELRVPTGRGRGRGRGRARGRGRRRRGGGRQQADELQRDRDPVSPLGGGPEGVGGHEAGGQIAGTLSGPLPGGYLSLRPPRSHHSDAGTSHQAEGPEVGTSQQEQQAVHGDFGTQFHLPFSPSDLGQHTDYQPILDTQDLLDVTMLVPEWMTGLMQGVMAGWQISGHIHSRRSHSHRCTRLLSIRRLVTEVFLYTSL